MSSPAHSNTAFRSYRDFVLIGNPVGHSLSPVMHNALYRHTARENVHVSNWRYRAIECETEEQAEYHINLVRTGKYRGMNVTTPFKRLALDMADFVDGAADAAGGANVLVRRGFDLCAYNTDGLGALGAISRMCSSGPRGARVVVCGTGPTAMAIVLAFADARAGDISLLSRKHENAERALSRVSLSLAPDATDFLHAVEYCDAAEAVQRADIFIDATTVGMHGEPDAVVDTSLFHSGQVVFDTVYGHGETALLRGAREQGACAADGLEMLVEQAALSIEIWADALVLPLEIDRTVMREAAVAEMQSRG